MMLLLIIAASFLIPYELGFTLSGNSTEQIGHKTFTRVTDLIFTIDISLQFFISYPRSGDHRWVRMPKAIVNHYIYTNFTLDVVSQLPYNELARFLTKNFGSQFQVLGMLKVLSLLKLGRVNRLIARYQALVDLPNALIKLTKLMVMLCMSFHWIACCWGFLFYVESFLDLYSGHTWPEALRSNKPHIFSHAHKETPWELYTASLYWSCMTITSIGYGDVVAQNPLEAWGATILMAMSGLVWANIIGSICAIAGNLDADNAEHENQLDSLNRMMVNLELPKDKCIHLREFFMCRKGIGRRLQQSALIQSMSPELQGRVARWIQATTMKKVWFFSGVSDAFVVQLLEHLEFAMYPPKELVRLPRSMIFLLAGVVLCGAKMLPPGSAWGLENALISNTDLLADTTALALSYIQLQHLTHEGLQKLCASFSEEVALIRKAAAWAALRFALRKGYISPSWSASVRGKHQNSSDSLRKGRITSSKLDQLLLLLRDLSSKLDLADPPRGAHQDNMNLGSITPNLKHANSWNEMLGVRIPQE